MSDTVLAVIELDNFPEEVARRATWLAQLYDCNLHLMLSDPTIAILRDRFLVSSETKRLAERVHGAQDETMQKLADVASDRGVDVSTSVSHDRPAADAIVEKARELNPEFVIKGTQYHSPAERAIFTFTDWELMRSLDYPLWLVKQHAWQEHPVIIAAVDPTHREDEEASLDQRIVDIGRSVAGHSGGKLVLLHTYQRLVEIGSHAMLSFKPEKLPIDELEQKMRDEHREKLDRLAARNEIPAADVHQLPGRTHEILPTFARAQGADLVVMGALSRSQRKRRMLGNTAERVTDHLHCDVLIARAG